MKKLILSAVAVCFLAACATDPYTGESKVSKTAWGTGIGTLAGAASAHWSAAKGCAGWCRYRRSRRCECRRLYGYSGAQAA